MATEGILLPNGLAHLLEPLYHIGGQEPQPIANPQEREFLLLDHAVEHFLGNLQQIANLVWCKQAIQSRFFAFLVVHV